MRSIPVGFLGLSLLIGLLLAAAPVRSADGSAKPSHSGMAVGRLFASTVSGSASSPARAKSAAAVQAELALEVLATRVRVQSHSDALHSAFEAYFNYRETHAEEIRKPYLYYVDFGLAATEPRGYIFDMVALEVVEGPFTVAHGRGSVTSGSIVPTLFSNRPGSNATSLGLFLTQETYSFSGKSGGQSYRSVGLRMRGLSGIFNSKARERGVVIHGAPYVTASKAGRSEGCPAMEPDRASSFASDAGWRLPGISVLARGSRMVAFRALDEGRIGLCHARPVRIDQSSNQGSCKRQQL